MKEDFWKVQFDKLIMLFVLLVLVGMVFWFQHNSNDVGFKWAERAYDNIQGALLMLLTGRSLFRPGDRVEDTNRSNGATKGDDNENAAADTKRV